eukprot:TRINITY_DN122591_c0_g1_i1.p1 TRINITY_DN122591_c0_g1~~TRINITY_DN122591_c0_g1_i1.p1  ORF type:complete len:572 (+),score=38.89 TRINITY_DN122591_c0_g1_i1:114-1829(+)
MEAHERHLVFGLCWCFSVLLFFAMVGPLITYVYLVCLPWTVTTCIVEDRGLSAGGCSPEECAPPWPISGGLRYCPRLASQEEAMFSVMIDVPDLASDDALVQPLSLPEDLRSSGKAAAQRCSSSNFSGGACQREAQGDGLEQLRMDCKYYAWALVRLLSSSKSALGNVAPTDPLCAFPLGLDSLNVNNIEDRDWETQCKLFERLGDKGEMISCRWQVKSLSQRPRVAFAPALTTRLTEEVWTIGRYATVCWLVCLGCLIWAAFSGNSHIFCTLRFLLLANLIVVTAVDLCQQMPICSCVVILVLMSMLWSAVLAGDWQMSRTASQQLCTAFVLVGFVVYACVGCLCFVDDLSVFLSFMTRLLATLIFFLLMKRLRKARPGRNNRSSTFALGSRPLLSVGDERQETPAGRHVCQSCGGEVLLCPCWPYPLFCIRCLVTGRWLSSKRQVSGALSRATTSQRFILKRLSNYFFQVRPVPATDPRLAAALAATLPETGLPLCLVCQEDTVRADCVFYPCGHGGLCERCARTMLESPRWEKHSCHMCRERVEVVVKISAVTAGHAVGSALLSVSLP